MTSLERTVHCLSFQPTDRVVIDYKGEPEVDERLIRDLCLSDYEALLQRLHVDIRRIKPNTTHELRWQLPDGTGEDYWGIRWKTMHAAHGTYNEFVWNPMWDAQTLADLEAHNWPTPDIFDYSNLSEQVERYADYGIVWEGWEGADLFTRPSILRGMENSLMDIALRPELAHYIYEKFTAFYCEDLTRALEATNGRITFATQWSDYGMQDRALLSLPMWREFVKPYLKRLIDVAHSGGAKFMTHSCGAIREFIPELLEIGVDILDPIQVLAKGMEPEGLMKDFGGKVCFHGSICTQSILPFGSPEEVAEAVLHRVSVFGKTGFMLAPSHYVQPDTSTANVLAMYDTAVQA